jgi:serine/threonine protein kinase
MAVPMTPPDDAAIIDEAAAAHSCTVIRAFARGGQKLVVLVDKSGDAVLKIVRVDANATAEALKRAQRESELLARTSNSHLVKGLSAAIELGSPVYAICWLEQYLDGSDLKDLVSSPWSGPDAFVMARDVSEALACLHGQGVVHRDLSAGNIRRLSNGRFMVMDPGFARYLNLSGVTGIGQPGTPGFLTPEHVQQGIVPTCASDVFALGILLWLTLTAALPIPCGDAVQYADKLASSQIPSIATVRRDLTQAQVLIVDRCLQRQLARRYFNGNEVLSAIEAL